MKWSVRVLVLAIGVVSSGAGHAQDVQILPGVCKSLDNQYRKFIELKHDYSNEISSLINNVACQQSNFANNLERNDFLERLNTAKLKWNSEIDILISVMKNHNNIKNANVERLNDLKRDMITLKDESKNFRNCAKPDTDKFGFILIPAAYAESITILSGIITIYSGIDLIIKNVKENGDKIDKEWISCADSIANLKI